MVLIVVGARVVEVDGAEVVAAGTVVVVSATGRATGAVVTLGSAAVGTTSKGGRRRP